MDSDQPESFVEQAATWLSSTELVVYIATGAVLLFYQFPAYKQFRTRALLLIIISGSFALFVTVFDQTIGRKGPPDPEHWWTYYLVRELAWLTTVIVGTVGSLMFLRDYIRLATRSSASAPSASTPTEPPPNQDDRSA